MVGGCDIHHVKLYNTFLAIRPVKYTGSGRQFCIVEEIFNQLSFITIEIKLLLRTSMAFWVGDGFEPKSTKFRGENNVLMVVLI